MLYYRHHPNLGTLWDLHYFFDSNLRRLSGYQLFLGGAYTYYHVQYRNTAASLIESIYPADGLDIKLSCLLHLYGHLPTASTSFMSSRQQFWWLRYQQLEHDSAIRVKKESRMK